MIVRSINPYEINEFCSVGLNEEKAIKFKERMLKAWEEKRSYPEWCFAVEQEGRFIARVAFDIFPSEPLNLMVWGLYAPEGCDYLKIGESLFCGAIKQLEGKGFKLIEYHLYGKDDSKFNENKELFLRSGFEIQQEKKNYMFTEGHIPELSGRLNFKALREVGEKKYIVAMKKVTEKTLDSYDEKDVKELGAEEAARTYFYGLKDIDFNEDWWKLAYEHNGEFAGLIVPHKFNEEFGAINYIGVEPEKRGNGYVKDLLIMGTSILKSDGIMKIIADIDINNFPMENALKEMGYKFNEKELVLEIRF
ncbi:MAG: pSRTUE45c [Clostridiales bacterium]|jgi:ribosomal protein S18 acetylase RimI-like enzyme|nr:pSRTUE45c [Clostridiales bacterium]